MSARRAAPAVLVLVGLALVGIWLAALPRHAAPSAQVVAAPVARTAPLEGTAVPAGQQRLYAGETADLADGAQLAVFGPRVGVPAGSAATLGRNALVPVAFTLDVTAGTTPLTVRPGDFSVLVDGSPAVVGQIFGDSAPTTASTLTQTAVRAAVPTTGSAAPVTLAPRTTESFVVPLRVIARTGSLVYAPGGTTVASWTFTAEDD